MQPPDKDKRDLQDRELQALAREAQQAPPGSPKRRWALTQLVGYIASIDRLCYPRGYSDLDEDELSTEARQELYLYICDNIEKYEVDRGPFMRWVNFLLQKRFFPQVAKRIREMHNPYPQEMPLGEGESGLFLSQILLECIEEDVDGKLVSTHIRGHPQANFRRLALLRLEGKKWKDISEELKIGTSTLSDFYQRKLPDLVDYLRECVITRSQLS